VIEKSSKLLSKVKISGGGRCNLTHNELNYRSLSTNYPRGAKALLGPFGRFGVGDLMSWFEERGVELYAAEDGRVFPRSDSSQSIVDCLLSTMEMKGVSVLTNAEVTAITRQPFGFVLEVAGRTAIRARHVLVTVGGQAAELGFNFLKSFGHTVVPPVPSLFTFNISDERLLSLQGVSVSHVKVSALDGKVRADGAILITHWGLSGPAVLKASAQGARLMKEVDYCFDVDVNWIPRLHRKDVLQSLHAVRQQSPKTLVSKLPSFGLPKRLWDMHLSRLSSKAPCVGEISNMQFDRLVDGCYCDRYQVNGRSVFKEEFVTCGGVSLDEVDFRSMESKLSPGLFFAGEVLDIDGFTGGFNLQAAWTGGWVAAQAIEKRLMSGTGAALCI
jgi:predicted Rossmann fold flavoprotein